MSDRLLPWLRTKKAIRSCLALVVCFVCQCAALATKLPPETRDSALKAFSSGAMRLDGSISLPDGSIVLPLMPGPARKGKSEPVRYPASADKPTLMLYENGWGHLRAEKKGDVLTVVLPADMPEELKKRLLACHFPPDLIVPDGIVLPKSLKPIIGELTITLMADEVIARPDFGQKRQPGVKKYGGAGLFALSSVTDGSIILVDGKTLNKTAEFPTEGTPCGMEFLDGKIYIADQAKNRVLLLDPIGRKFLGQIDLTPGSTPKGVACVPNGQLTYVSESAPSDIAVLETATGKVLVKTKVPTGPSAIAMTSDGVYLVVLCATSGEMSVISAYNQKIVGNVRVGTVPTCVALNSVDKIAFVSNRRSNSISVVDISKRVILKTIPVGNNPTGLVLSRDGEKLYVAHGQDSTVWAFDTKTFLKTAELKLPLDVDFPGPMSLSPDGKTLVVTSQQTDTIAIIDTDTMTMKKTLPVGHRTQYVLWVPNEN